MKIASKPLVSIAFLCVSLEVIFAFHLNMIMIPQIKPPPGFPPVPQIPSLAGSVTSSLISNLAIEALKRRLSKEANIECNVNAEPTELIKGRIGPVNVKGRRWRSPLGLSCRMIEAEVGNCMINLASAIQNQKLRLTVPARGTAMVSFDATDFGNFLIHPLIIAPSHRHEGKGHKVRFLQGNTIIDAKSSSVTFFIEYLEKSWKCVLTNPSQSTNAQIQVFLSNGRDNISEEEKLLEFGLSNTITNFFNNMIIDLSGTYVSFNGMSVNENERVSPTVLIGLNILVKKFPSRKLAF